MIKISKNEHLLEAIEKSNNISDKLIERTLEIIKILSDNYGTNRDIEKDLGGFVAWVENVEDTLTLEGEYKLRLTIPEEIEAFENEYSLFYYQLSSDYSLILIGKSKDLKILDKSEGEVNGYKITE